MRKMIQTFVITYTLWLGPSIQAQNFGRTEKQFFDLFKTSGYATLYGAAIGTALLAFTESPGKNLRFIALGGSVGFLSGTAMGTYLMVRPSLSMGNNAYSMIDSGNTGFIEKYEQALVISPIWNRSQNCWSGIEASLTVANL